MIAKSMQWTCALTLAASALMAQTTAPVARVHQRTSGMVGVAEGQTARLNLLNPGVAAAATTTTSAALCSAAVAFVDAHGAVLKSAAVTVIPGQSTSFDLDGDADLKLAVNERHEIRATIQIPAVVPPPAASEPPEAARCRLIPTLEIFDTLTGRTAVVLGHTHFAAERAEPTPAASN